MNKYNSTLLDKHKDILSFRDLSAGTVATYVSYMNTYIQWTEENLSGKPLENVTWEELRSYIRYLKEVRGLNSRTALLYPLPERGPGTKFKDCKRTYRTAPGFLLLRPPQELGQAGSPFPALR